MFQPGEGKLAQRERYSGPPPLLHNADRREAGRDDNWHPIRQGYERVAPKSRKVILHTVLCAEIFVQDVQGVRTELFLILLKWLNF